MTSMPTKLSELLRRGWCRMAFAMKPASDNDPASFINCHYNDPAACRFCLLGGLKRLGFNDSLTFSNLQNLRGELFPRSTLYASLSGFNDTWATKEQVIHLVEEAERRGILRYQ